MNRRAAPYRPRALTPIRRVAGLEYDVLDDLLGYSLRRAQVAMFMAFHEATRGMAITPPRFTALVMIGANPGLSQTVLGNVLGIARSGAMLLTNWFVAEGLVERRHRPDDARAWGLYLTTQGEAMVQRMKRRVVAFDRKRAAVLSTLERRELQRLLAKLAA
ncbi:MAG TPA: MarR family winged helix-turn-helix transcriptional regulator [Burkholderiales bacterium]|nr:MarR family winged helix-turn-helix transcriptional regulator [Burkholderiales bacterium]